MLKQSKKRPAWVNQGWSPENELHERVARIDAVVSLIEHRTRWRMQLVGVALLAVATVLVGCALR